jgi:hypothetical protein
VLLPLGCLAANPCPTYLLLELVALKANLAGVGAPVVKVFGGPFQLLAQGLLLLRLLVQLGDHSADFLAQGGEHQAVAFASLLHVAS